MRPLMGVVFCGVFAAACATGPSTAVGSGVTAPTDPFESSAARELFGLVPADAQTLIWVDVAQLRASAWTRAALASAAPEERQARAAARGFDEIADVDAFVLARLSPSEVDSSLTIVRGRFDRGRVGEAIKTRWPQGAPSSFRGSSVWSHGDEAVAFATEDTLLSGPLAAVRAAIDCGSGRARSVRTEAWFSEMRRALPENGAAEAGGPSVALAMKVDPAMRERLRDELGEGHALERLAGRIDLGQELRLALVGVTAGRQKAIDMAARLREAVAGVRRRPSLVALGLAGVFEELRLGAEGTKVIAELRLSAAQRDDISSRLATVSALLSRAGANPSQPAPQSDGSQND